MQSRLDVSKKLSRIMLFPAISNPCTDFRQITHGRWRNFELLMSTLNQQLHLPDGRRLGYAERGPSDGKPLFYFHGSPSSRIEAALFVSEGLLQMLNVRLIAVDRPGMGLSDFQPGRQIKDWPGDVVALADHLGIGQFALLAYSLGGPYGLVCAFAIPERLTQTGIASGAALFTEPALTDTVNAGTRRFLNMPREKPLAARLFLAVMLGVMPRIAPHRFVAGASAVLPDPDREIVLSDSTFQEQFIQMVREATRKGTRGAFHESLLAVTAWNFRLQEVQAPILLWHGEADQNIPVAMARFAAAELPNCEAKFFPNEGHLSLFKNRAEEILRALTNQPG
jgi:pimeloyl-ACP methyl ester carboxylesterase